MEVFNLGEHVHDTNLILTIVGAIAFFLSGVCLGFYFGVRITCNIVARDLMAKLYNEAHPPMPMCDCSIGTVER